MMFIVYMQVKQLLNDFLTVAVWWFEQLQKKKNGNQTEIAISSWYNAAIELFTVALCAASFVEHLQN